MYVCPKCNKDIVNLEPKVTRCPHCGNKIVYKRREPVAREVSTD